MKKFKYKANRKLSYRGEQYLPGDILEFEEFDNALPIDWFEEVKEEDEEVRDEKELQNIEETEEFEAKTKTKKKRK